MAIKFFHKNCTESKSGTVKTCGKESKSSCSNGVSPSKFKQKLKASNLFETL